MEEENIINNGWNKESETTIKGWRKDLSESSFIYNERLDKISSKVDKI